MTSKNILDELSAVIEQRRDADPQSSYVASLHSMGIDKILEKFGEEAFEAVIAAKNVAAVACEDQTHENEALLKAIKEMADVWFHSLVVLSYLHSDHRAVLDELCQRFGVSGIEEKRQRKQ